MAFSTGTRLGVYEIVSPLGAGGMGEVYRARDTKLGREVAIKVLPQSVARDAERLARLQREAQVLASLNHPNIAQIYGLEDGALVMEYVPGENLRGPVALDEAMRLARQIAAGLEAAHEKGIVHRDLKPANIKVTPSGQVKVLDFGLAKAVEEAPANLSTSPTLSVAATRAGVILGTASYMSPEQARGKSVDKRADIWAFACVLYELLTGKQAFPGETVSDSLAAILAKEPDWSSLPSGSPEGLLRRCLQKDATARLRDIGDWEAVAPEPAAANALPPPSGWIKPAVWALFGLLSGLAIAIGLGMGAWLQRSSRPLIVSARFSVVLPPDERLAVRGLSAVAISPDGTQVAYVAVRTNTTQLYVRPLDRMEARLIPGTEGAEGPFFSPDGGSVGFFAAGKLKKVLLSTGAIAAICDVSAARGGAWLPDQTIVYSPSPGSGLFRVPAAGGTPQVLTKPDPAKGEASHRFPYVLPGGQSLLFTLKTTEVKSFDDARIAVLSLQTGRFQIVAEGGTSGQYSSGHLVYARAGKVLAAPFDLGQLKVTGQPTVLMENVVENPSSGAVSFDISQQGVLTTVPGPPIGAGFSLAWVDRQGTTRTLPAPDRAYFGPRISPDGRRIATRIGAAFDELWLYELDRGALSRITFSGGINYGYPVWSPDGKRVVYSRFEGTANAIVQKAMEGNGKEESLLAIQGQGDTTSVSPDGKSLVFTRPTQNTGLDIVLLDLVGHKTRDFLQTPFNETEAVFSPDGKWLAYSSDMSGRWEVYVTAFPSGEGRWQISADGGTEPMWARKGQELFFRNGDKMMTTTIETKSGFHASKPTQLFEAEFERDPSVYTNYDVSADGRQFLMVKAQQLALRQLHVVIDGLAELKRNAR